MAEHDTDNLKQDLSSLRNEMQELATAIRDSSEKYAHIGMEHARDAYAEARQEAQKQTQAVGAEIETRPFTSVAVAFGAGFIAGKLLGR